MSEDTNFLVIMADMREKRSKVCGYLEKSQKAVVKYVDLAIGDYICGPEVGSEWGSWHIILLILQLKRLNFASNMAQKTAIFRVLFTNLQVLSVARPGSRKKLNPIFDITRHSVYY